MSSTSGIGLSEEVTTAFGEMKLNKQGKGNSMQLLILQIQRQDDGVEVINVNHDWSLLECNNDQMHTFYENHENDCCYGIHDFQLASGKKTLVAFMWVPDTAPVRQKMIYAASKDALKTLPGLSKFINATEISELNLVDIQKKVESKV